MKKSASVILVCMLLVLLCSCGTVSNDAAENPAHVLEPFSKEFSVSIDGQALGLGQQSGDFPWGTSLQEQESKFWSSDGFDSFEIVCKDGTVLSGLRSEGCSNAADGTILSIATDNPSIKMYRGAYVGMSLSDVLDCYPEAVHQENAGAGENVYMYSAQASGLSKISLYFNDDILASIVIDNEIDG